MPNKQKKKSFPFLSKGGTKKKLQKFSFSVPPVFLNKKVLNLMH